MHGTPPMRSGSTVIRSKPWENVRPTNDAERRSLTRLAPPERTRYVISVVSGRPPSDQPATSPDTLSRDGIARTPGRVLSRAFRGLWTNDGSFRSTPETPVPQAVPRTRLRRVAVELRGFEPLTPCMPCKIGGFR
jgi:hypothetical protein